jgi:hypothetical protein
MLSFDAKLVLRLSSRPKGLMKGEKTMSDEWIGNMVRRIKQSDEETLHDECPLRAIHRANVISARQIISAVRKVYQPEIQSNN